MSSDSTTTLLNDLRGGSQQLLRGCTKLAESLPTSPYLVKDDWPILLGHFRSVGRQLAETGAKVSGELQHSVPVPTHPAAAPDGTPTLTVPDLLRTKKPPEQEAEIEKVMELIKPFLPDEDKTKAERENIADGRLAQFRRVMYQYNQDLESAITSFSERPDRLALRKKCTDVVTKHSGKSTTGKPTTGVDLFAYMYNGTSKQNAFHVVEAGNK